jgi:hypothetical protein
VAPADKAWRVREIAAKVIARHGVGDAFDSVAGLRNIRCHGYGQQPSVRLRSPPRGLARFLGQDPDVVSFVFAQRGGLLSAAACSPWGDRPRGGNLIPGWPPGGCALRCSWPLLR